MWVALGTCCGAFLIGGGVVVLAAKEVHHVSGHGEYS